MKCLLAPLMQVEPIAADFVRRVGGVIVTSANAPGALPPTPRAAR